MPYQGMPTGRRIRFNLADYEAIKNQITEAELVAPRAQLGGHRGANNVERGRKSGAFEVMGDKAVIAEIDSIHIRRGRFLNELDELEGRKVAVIGPRVEEVLFEKGENPVGEAIRINGVYFKVVGVHAPEGRTGEQAERDEQRVYIPFATFRSAFNFGDRVQWFAITSRADVGASVLQEKVVSFLKERHHIHPDDRRGIGYFNLEERFQKVQGLFLGIGALIWIVGIGTLAAGVIGVSNILLIIVKERTKEIGLRRAVGATPTDITIQIIVESVVITAVAGYVGLVAGVGLLEWLRFFIEAMPEPPGMFHAPGVDFSLAMKALLILVVSGVIAGLMPARRALAISPVEALRSE